MRYTTLFFSRSTLGLALVLGLLGTTGCSISALPEDAIQRIRGTLSSRLGTLLPADVLLLGEQHNAPDHQQIQRQMVTQLADKGQLAALALEMAEAGTTTARLSRGASPEQTRKALQWDEKIWPWAVYAPAIMTAVQAGVPVLGANLPRSQMQASMEDATLDDKLPGPAFTAQQQLMRSSHCDQLPEDRVSPMARIQVARDMRMANTLAGAVVPGKVVVLLSGSVHADRELGVPQHLPPNLKVKAVRLRSLNRIDDSRAAAFDAVWSTPALTEKDPCDGLRGRFIARLSGKLTRTP